MWYEVKGTGSPLLQIGGAGFAHTNFHRVTDTMAQFFTVIDMDQSGNGLSDAPVRQYTIDGWADDAAGVLDAAGVGAAFVHGTSTGGMIALRLATKYPQKVRALVVGSTAAKYDFMGYAQMRVRRALAETYGLASAELAYDVATLAFSRQALSERGPEIVELARTMREKSNSSFEVWLAMTEAMMDADLRDELPRIEAPTLVIGGDQDINTPLDQGPDGAGTRFIAEQIPNAELLVLEGAAHTILVEEPERVASAVIAFLQTIEKG